MKRHILLFALLLPTTVSAVTPSVGDVKDSRTTGQFFAGLEIEVKLVGDELSDYKAVRTTIEKAVDDTGRDIINAEENKSEFEELGQFGMNPNAIQLKFKNPARKASTVSQITGKFEFYNPSLDPQATLKFPKVLSMTGKPLENPSLKSAGVVVTVLTAEDIKKRQEEQAKKQAEEARKQGMSEAMIASMGQFFGGMMQGGANEISLEINDPSNKLVSLRFVKTDNSELHRNSTMTSGNMRTLGFNEPIPQDVVLELQILTPKTLAMVPISLTNVALP